MKERLDLLLVEKKIVPTRSQAQQLIKGGEVSVNGKIILRASSRFSYEDEITLCKEFLYVGRGGKKIEGATQDFGLCFKDKVIGDMGASTGGFSQFALLHGAKKIYAVDVGHGQLDEKLRDDERLINLEGVNIREGLPLELFKPLCDMLVVDLSFISLTLVLSSLSTVLKKGGEFLFLVKPQFEGGRQGLGKNGVVRNPEVVKTALEKVRGSCGDNLFMIEKESPCTLKGKMGNQEYFFYGYKL